MENPSEKSSKKLQLSYRLLFERNPLPMWVYDVKTLRMLAVNQAALAHYGYSEQEFVGLTLLDLHHEDDIAQVQAHLKRPADQRAATQVWRHRRRNGDLIEVEMVTEAVEFDGTYARVALVRDVTEQRRTEQAQRDLAERLATTMESITDAFLTLDRAWRITYVNSRAEQTLRSLRGELLGCNLWERFPETVGSTCHVEFERAMAENVPVRFEAFYPQWGAWLEVNAFPSVQGLAVYCRDVTEKHATGQRLIEERETLTAVVNSTDDAVISVDVQGLIKMFNPGAERIFRRTHASMHGQTMEVLLPERFQVAHRQHLRPFAESGVVSRMMGMGLVKGLRADGQELDLEGTISQVTVYGQQVLIVTLRDVTKRLQDDAEYKHSRAQLSELTQRLMIQEKTLVKRLAQALHDQLGQTMAAIRMAHETIITLQRGKTTPGIDSLQAQMGKLISQAIRQVRQVLIDLRPPLLEEHGLAAALDNELRNRSLTQPHVDISVSVPPEVAVLRWPSEVEYAAFMVAREAVENSLRHSGASSVAVRLTGTAISLQLEITDKGVGITPGATQRTGHLGILGMQERAQA
ncbi:MAG: PAS domain S-box protein, partial [Rhodoferax sp.]